MNNNYLIYNNLGILKNSQLEEISQGNHNVDYYYIAYDSYDYTNGFVTLSCTLPDGTSLPELSTSPKDFEFNGEKYKGFLFVVRDTLTAQAGVLSMTFNLKSVENDTQLCSSRLNVTIHESDVSTEPTINQAQYDQMQEVIRENTVKANEALEKANEAYFHDATLVKINGEIQPTWDATFAQELYEKSINLFNSRDVNQGSSVESINNRVHIIFLNKVKAGDTYTISRYNENIRYSIGYKGSPNQSADIIHESGWKTDSSYSLTAREDSYLFVNFSYADNSAISPSDIKPTDFQIEKGSVATPHKPYNSSSHITNGQADFLKEQYDKSISQVDFKSIKYNNHNSNHSISNEENPVLTINPILSVAEGKTSGGVFFALSNLGNKTYNISFSAKANINWSLSAGVEGGAMGNYPLTTSYQRFGLAINPTVGSFVFYVYVNNDTGEYPTQIEIKDLMVVEGNETPEEVYLYQGGEIVHIGDIEPVTLFDGWSQTSLTLTDYWYNYEYIDIYHRLTNGRQTSTRIYTNINMVNLSNLDIDNTVLEDYGFINNYKLIEFDGKNLNVLAAGRWYRYQNGGDGADQTDYMVITKILGYKEV